jgi:hypothetical protein
MTAITARAALFWGRTADWNLERIALLGSLTVGAIVGIFQALGGVPDPFDAHFYWSAPVDHLYPAAWADGGYVYPPPLALAIGVFHPIGWPAFIVGWTTLCWFALWYCARAWTPLVVAASIAAVPLIGGNVLGTLFLGNVQVIFAAAIVASVRHNAGWAALPILTKGVGMPFVWFAVRREWRNVAIATGVTVGIVVVTLFLAPTAWSDFVHFMSTNDLSGSAVPVVPIDFAVRLMAAVGLTAWGGLTDRRWTLAIAAGIAIPALYWWSWLTVWVGVLALVNPGRSKRA